MPTCQRQLRPPGYNQRPACSPQTPVSVCSGFERWACSGVPSGWPSTAGGDRAPGNCWRCNSPCTGLAVPSDCGSVIVGCYYCY